MSLLPKQFGSLFLLLLLMLTGCAQTSEQSQHPKMPPLILDLLKRDQASGILSDFEVQVLEDAWVSDEEWNQAKSLFTACMNEHGLEGSLGDGTSSQYGATESDQDKFAANYPPEDRLQALDDIMELAETCAKGTVSNVGVYYFEPRNNPDGLGYEESVRRCVENTEFAADIAGLTDTEVIDFVDEATANYANPQLQPCREGHYGEW